MILYLCVMENTLNNNIHKNQILPLIKQDDRIVLLFLAPFFILSKNYLGINNQKYQEKSIHHIRIPLFSYNFSMNPILVPFLLFLSIPWVLLLVFKHKIKTIHSRNHLSSLVAIVVKFFLRDIFILSDFRGLYAEEGVVMNRWKYNSWKFKFWKYIEKIICKNSDVITSISQNMTNYLSETYSLDNVKFIPAIVDTKRVYFCSRLREEFRRDNKILKNEVVFIYIGSIGLWHDIPSLYDHIGDYIKKFQIRKYRIFILSNLNYTRHSELHNKYGAKILNVSPDAVNKYLCGADIGVLPGTKNNGLEFDLLYKTMISSKLEEYLCAGLKVISNERIEEVCSMISNVFSDYPIVQENYTREKIANKYQDMFSSDKIKFLYKKLLNEKSN